MKKLHAICTQFFLFLYYCPLNLRAVKSSASISDYSVLEPIFADPYCSGQKGAVENANKILREYFPKGTDFRRVTQPELNNAQYQINENPRKKLNFSSPKIEFYRRIC